MRAYALPPGSHWSLPALVVALPQLIMPAATHCRYLAHKKNEKITLTVLVGFDPLGFAAAGEAHPLVPLIIPGPPNPPFSPHLRDRRPQQDGPVSRLR